MKQLIIAICITCLGLLPQAQAHAQEIKILSYNILHGATTRGDFNMDHLASVIKEINPDLVALQEVDRLTRRAKGLDLVTELAWRTKMLPFYGKSMNFNGGAYGVGILSRFPVVSSRNVVLPSSSGNEPRTSLEILFEIDKGDTIRFVATHLDHKAHSPDRLDQVRQLNSLYGLQDYPSILAGDLNDIPESQSIGILKEYWTLSHSHKLNPTYPSDDPEKKIDYILYSPKKNWEVIETKVTCDTTLTDHCVVFTRLRLLE